MGGPLLSGVLAEGKGLTTGVLRGHVRPVVQVRHVDAPTSGSTGFRGDIFDASYSRSRNVDADLDELSVSPAEALGHVVCREQPPPARRQPPDGVPVASGQLSSTMDEPRARSWQAQLYSADEGDGY
jgi:hypothetical protein